MQLRPRVRAHVLWVVAALASFASIANALPARSSVLTTAREVHSMSRDEATRQHPVQLRAVLTYYDPYIDPRRGAIFVCDKSGCVFVSIPARPILPLHSGDLVEIAGVTGPGDYASIVDASEIRAIGKSSLPVPRKVSSEELFSGKYDCDWIRVQGVIRAVHYGTGTVALEILSNGRTFPAGSVRQPGTDYEKLIDSQIELTANTSPVFNSRRQMVGVHTFFPTVDQVRVIRAAPNDPFELPPMRISDLFGVSTGSSLSHRVHIEGTLTLDWPGRMICIQSDADALCMDTRQKTRLLLGAPVGVVGFPIVNTFKPTLEEASFRELGGIRPLNPPVRLTANQEIDDSLDGRPIEFDAELIGEDLAAVQPTLMLRRGSLLIPALIPREELAGRTHLWKDSSRLRVTGICSVQMDTWSISLGNGKVQPESVRLLLRSTDDVVVLHAPSWWTPQHALATFAVIGVIVLGAFAWIIVLRHSVKQRTRELHESRERLRYLSEHDALTGLPNRVLIRERLRMALESAGRNSGHLGLLMSDVDGFKAVNDELGHQAGDRLLCELARRLSECVRPTDTVARIGGDEFLILLPDLHEASDAGIIASKIVAAIAGPLSIEGKMVEISMSIGVVVYPEHGTDAQALMRHADQAMYGAKSAGKNGFRYFGMTTLTSKNGNAQKVSPVPRTAIWESRS
jgi:diguanylate cyclase (GGDEF)-like protein